MKEIAVAVGVAIVIGGLAWLIRGRVAEQHVVRLSDIPEVFERLVAQGTDGSFAVFMFRDHGHPGGEQVNLQFSNENGTVGLDWVLIGPANIRDENQVFELLQAHGSKPSRLEQNSVKYIRAEQGDLVRLSEEIISGLYGVKSQEEFDLVPEGFVWNR